MVVVVAVVVVVVVVVCVGVLVVSVFPFAVRESVCQEAECLREQRADLSPA